MRDYRERLAVPAAWWVLAVPVILLLGAYAIYADLSALIVVIVYVVFTAGYVAALLAWSSAVIEVTGGQLRAAGSVLPLAPVSAVQPLDEDQGGGMWGPAGPRHRVPAAGGGSGRGQAGPAGRPGRAHADPPVPEVSGVSGDRRPRR